MQSQPVEHLQQHPLEDKVRRNLHSCQHCRKDKKFCNFLDRPWNEEEQGPPCGRCKEKDRDCGGPVYIQRKLKTTANTNATIEEHLTQERGRVEDQPRQPQQQPRSHIEQEQHSTRAETNPVHNGLRPMQPWVPADTTSSDEEASSLDHILIQLGDTLAVRELVRSCMYICEDVRHWRGGTCEKVEQVMADLLRLKAAIGEMFARIARSASYPSVLSDASQSYRADLRDLHYRFQNPSQRSTRADSNDDTFKDLETSFSRLRDEDYNRQRKSGTYSHADHLCHNVCRVMDSGSPPSCIDLGRDIHGSLLRAAQAVAKVIAKVRVSSQDEQYSSLRVGATGVAHKTRLILTFPFCQLALLQADDHILHRCMRKPPRQSLDTDAIGRTFFHSAAYLGRSRTLETVLMEHENKSIISMVEPDVFGLLPHMIAACKNDVHAFNLFIQHGADLLTVDHHSRTALDFAAMNGSTDVVASILAYMLEKQITYASYLNPMIFAIERQQHGVVEVFLDHYSAHELHHPEGMQEAADFASARGLADLSSQIQAVVINRPSIRKMVIGSLENLHHQDQILQQLAMDPFAFPLDPANLHNSFPLSSQGPMFAPVHNQPSFDGDRFGSHPLDYQDPILEMPDPEHRRQRTQGPTGPPQQHDAG